MAGPEDNESQVFWPCARYLTVLSSRLLPKSYLIQDVPGVGVVHRRVPITVRNTTRRVTTPGLSMSRNGFQCVVLPCRHPGLGVRDESRV